jgi:hypothetical protein
MNLKKNIIEKEKMGKSVTDDLVKGFYIRTLVVATGTVWNFLLKMMKVFMIYMN